jgi:hypothetical protein
MTADTPPTRQSGRRWRLFDNLRSQWHRSPKETCNGGTTRILPHTIWNNLRCYSLFGQKLWYDDKRHTIYTTVSVQMGFRYRSADQLICYHMDVKMGYQCPWAFGHGRQCGIDRWGGTCWWPLKHRYHGYPNQATSGNQSMRFQQKRWMCNLSQWTCVYVQQ